MFTNRENNQNELIITLKCVLDKAKEYRQEFHCVVPGYYMNKTHWNLILLKNCDVSKPLLEHMIHMNLYNKGLSVKQKEHLRKDITTS
ncbi:MmcQ/YjbR family DNA-binding protein [Salipaludibacillus sp. LMS25]|uniref:MmcQ/YjbR family DNA-binding protein n=1 Tax=Salipaludibacillus sp. LMS25 TaxID=2924031 RepID=UPI0034E939F2